MTFAVIYVASLFIVLLFIFYNGAQHREGGVIVSAMAFMPIINSLLALSCIATVICNYIIKRW